MPVVLSLAACGSGGGITVPSPGEKAKLYGEQLAAGLAESDLTSAEADCVHGGIFARWTPEALIEAGLRPDGLYTAFFRTADELTFQNLVLSSDDAGSTLMSPKPGSTDGHGGDRVTRVAEG